MASYGATEINLQLDTKEALAGTGELGQVLKELKAIASSVGASISKAFAPVVDSVRKIQLGVDDVNESVSKLVNSLTAVKTSAEAPADTGGLLTSITEGYGGIIEALKKYEEIEKYGGKIQTLFEDILTAPNISNLFQSMFPNVVSLIGSVGTAFSTVATWVTGTLVPAITTGLGLIASALGMKTGDGSVSFVKNQAVYRRREFQRRCNVR